MIKKILFLFILTLFVSTPAYAVVGELNIEATTATTSGNFYAPSYADTANPAYYLTPSNASQSLVTAGKASFGTTVATQTINVGGGIGFSNGPIIRDNSGKLELQAGGTGTGASGNGSIYFLDSSGTTRARIDTTGSILQKGTGGDGACTVSSNTNLNTASCIGRALADAIAYSTTSNVAAAATSVPLTNGVYSTSAGLVVGDEVLTINLQGTSGDNANVGQYETKTISAITTPTNTLGTGTDGSCAVNAQTGDVNLNSASCVGRAAADAVNFSVTTNAPVGAKQIDIANTTGLAVGDEVLIINLQGTGTDNANVGQYETKTITSLAAIHDTGDGADGACAVNAQTGDVNLNSASCVGRALADAIAYSTTSNISAGATTIPLTNSTYSTAAGLSVGDEVLVIDLQGTSGDNASVGQYETKTISAITPVTNNTGTGADGACTVSSDTNINTASCAGRGTPDAQNYYVTSLGTNTIGNATTGTAPVGWWKMNEAANDTCADGKDVCDSGSGGNNGTVTGTTITTGYYGNSRNLNGTSSDFITINDAASLQLSTAFSFGAWVYRNADNSASYERVLSKSNTDSPGYDYWLQIFPGNLLGCGVLKANAADYYRASAVTVPTNTWVYVACTFDSTNGFNMYINGDLSNGTVTGTIGAARTSTRALEIGRLGTGGAYYYAVNSKIDDVRIYNYVRTADQIAEDMGNAGASITGIAQNDEILLINLQGSAANNANVGTYETLTVQSVSGNTITTTTNIQNIYGATSSNSSLTGQWVMVQRVPNYTSVTVDATKNLTASAWNGTIGGVLMFRANGTVTVAATGSITATGLGYQGGVGPPSAVDYQRGQSGEGIWGQSEFHAASTAAWGGGGGTGQGADGSGGGGGHGTVGTAGSASLVPNSAGGAAGGTNGNANLTTLFFGGGGGSSGDHTTSRPGVSGGKGGGIIYITSQTLSVSGSIVANGTNGSAGLGTGDANAGAGGGGGAGGSIYLGATNITPGTISANAGAGGVHYAGKNGKDGGAGGVGRIYVNTQGLNGGTFSPNPVTPTISISFATGLTNGYNGTTQKIMIQRIPNYTSVTVDNGRTLTPSAWDGTKYGVLMFRTTGTVTNNGTIKADGLGFQPGATYVGSTGGYQGTSYTGPGTNPNSTARQAANGGGGGSTWDSGYNSGLAEGGGGGGYGAAGTAGTYSHSSYPGQGAGGAAYGTANLSTIFLGSSGGAGGSGDNGATWGVGNGTTDGKGGAGGGILFIAAATLTNNGTVSSNGNTGNNGWGWTTSCTQYICGGGGGSGSGGSIYIDATTVTAGTMTATGGGTTSGGGANGWGVSHGGAGAVGRVAINSLSVSGSSTPAFYQPSSSISFATGLTNSYNGATQKIMVQRIPNYTSVTVDNGRTLTASAWNGTIGGVLMFRATGTVTNNGTIHMNATGYRPGATYVGLTTAGYQGETVSGTGANGTRNPNNTRGGGPDWAGSGNTTYSGGGGGGSYGTAGANATTDANTTMGLGGTTTYGTANLSSLFFGSAGGAGGSGYNGSAWGQGNGTTNGLAGAGGGIMYIAANTLTNSGTISSNGGNGNNGWGFTASCGQSICGGGGGGGAGGSLYLDVASITPGTINATGGTGGSGQSGSYGGGYAPVDYGGAGGSGRIYINTKALNGGTISPNPVTPTISISFATGLTNGYNGTTQKIMVQRIPQYTSVTVNEGQNLTASAWDGTKGGVLMFRATGTITNNGTIHMNGNGYQPGATYTSSTHTGFSGESYTGAGVRDSASTPNANGGGGGANWSSGTLSYTSGGGGGGYGTAGAAGILNNNPTVGAGGGTYGTANLSTLFMGSAGGAGGSGYNGAWYQGNGTTDGKGGAGGGIVYLMGATLTNNGTISSNGSQGNNGWGFTTSCGQSICGGGGGSGAGGSVYIGANTVTIGTMTASGGAQTNGGQGSYGAPYNVNSRGGAGGAGRIFITYTLSLTGITTPVATVDSGYGTFYLGAANTSSSDVAEHYGSREKLIAGDVVSLDPNNPFYIKKATQADQKLLGIISTDPGVILGQGDLPAGKDPTYPVALAGRVPVRVDPASSPIHIGDTLTVSPTMPGSAIKATQSEYGVAKALENWKPGDEDSIQAFLHVEQKAVSKPIAGNDLVRGILTIKPGENTFSVSRKWEEIPISIHITPSYSTTSYITDLSDRGFQIHVGTPSTKEEYIYWQAWW